MYQLIFSCRGRNGAILRALPAARRLAGSGTHRHHGAERVARIGRDPGGRQPTPVVSDQDRVVSAAERGVQFHRVEHQRTDPVVAVAREFGGRVAAHERGDHAETLRGEVRAQVPPGPRGVGVTVQAQHQPAVRRPPGQGLESQVRQVQGHPCGLSHIDRLARSESRRVGALRGRPSARRKLPVR